MKNNAFSKTKLTSIFVVFFNLLCVNQLSYSQSRYNSVYENKLILGMNIIDDSFTKTHNAFNYDQQWNVAAYPSFFGYNYLISENISIEGMLSMNKYNAKKLVDGVYIPTERKYHAFDFNAKYNLSSLIYDYDSLSNFEPFIAIGAGITSIENKSRSTINYGFGTYIWLNKYENKCCSESILNNLGFVFQTMGKSSLDQNTYGNQIQHTFGVVFRF
jgi:hypothetical protein